MPDTGAPWNIPYADPTDLVRDWPALSEDIAEAVADGLDDASLFRQIVQTVKSDTFTTTSTSYTALTGLSVSITPSSATNKVLVIVQVGGATQTDVTNSIGMFRLMRGASAIAVGDTSGSRSPATGAISARDTGASNIMFSVTTPFLDSPGVATAVTYSVEAKVGGGTMYINRGAADADNVITFRTVSTITAIEVAA
jgi:hypothetical protein